MNIMHDTQMDAPPALAWISEGGRIFMDIGSITLTMTAEEAKALATTLQNAAVRATALVPVEEAA